MSADNTYLVPIDRDSVRKNPNAGRTMYILSGPAEAKLLYHLPETLATAAFYDKFSHALKHSVAYSMHCFPGMPFMEVKGRCYGDIEQAIQEIRHLTGIPDLEVEAAIKCEHRVVHSMRPEAEYLYMFESTDVKCSWCGHWMDYTELESDYIDDCGPVEHICPKCGEPECCSVAFEALPKETLKELSHVNDSRGASPSRAGDPQP